MKIRWSWLKSGKASQSPFNHKPITLHLCSAKDPLPIPHRLLAARVLRVRALPIVIRVLLATQLPTHSLPLLSFAPPPPPPLHPYPPGASLLPLLLLLLLLLLLGLPIPLLRLATSWRRQIRRVRAVRVRADGQGAQLRVADARRADGEGRVTGALGLAIRRGAGRVPAFLNRNGIKSWSWAKILKLLTGTTQRKRLWNKIKKKIE